MKLQPWSLLTSRPSGTCCTWCPTGRVAARQVHQTACFGCVVEAEYHWMLPHWHSCKRRNSKRVSHQIQEGKHSSSCNVALALSTDKAHFEITAKEKCIKDLSPLKQSRKWTMDLEIWGNESITGKSVNERGIYPQQGPHISTGSFWFVIFCSYLHPFFQPIYCSGVSR